MTTSLPLPLRVVERRLREPLDQGEPMHLPDQEHNCWVLAANFHGDNNGKHYVPADYCAGEQDGEHDADELFDDSAAAEVSEGLKLVEFNELKVLKALQKHRRTARAASLDADIRKRKLDAGWIELNGVWMYPGIINPSVSLGVPAQASQRSESKEVAPTATPAIADPTPEGVWM